jgi:hypothetical protein
MCDTTGASNEKYSYAVPISVSIEIDAVMLSPYDAPSVHLTRLTEVHELVAQMTALSLPVADGSAVAKLAPSIVTDAPPLVGALYESRKLTVGASHEKDLTFVPIRLAIVTVAPKPLPEPELILHCNTELVVHITVIQLVYPIWAEAE